MEVQYISLNMTPTGVNPCFHISQYDVGRMLGFIVHSGGATVDLDTYTCTIEATRSDGTAITSAVVTTDNIGTFEVTPTMSNKADKYRCQLVIVNANSKRIASLPFDMEVTKAAMDENAESIEEDASLYQQYTQQVQSAIAEIRTDEKALKIDISSFSSLPKTVNNENIKADMIVIEKYLSNPAAVVSDWTITASNGSITITGTISGSTSLTLYLMKSR